MLFLSFICTRYFYGSLPLLSQCLVNINEWFSGPSTLLHCLCCRSQRMIKVMGKKGGLDLKMSGFIKVALPCFWSTGNSGYPNGAFLSHLRK